jgi:hypothetical protein
MPYCPQILQSSVVTNDDIGNFFRKPRHYVQINSATPEKELPQLQLLLPQLLIVIIIIMVTETISKSLNRQYLNNIPWKHEIKELQKKKKAILGTAHKLREVLM